MKKYLLPLLSMLLGSVPMYGQSITFSNLVYFSNLSNDGVYENLVQGNSFRQDYTVDVNGHQIEYFKNIGARPNTEKIAVGNFVKMYDGSILRTVTYTTTNPQYIINMVAQAKNYGLELKFRGVDNTNNIYLYDNDYYHVSIYLKRDQTSGGMVEIKQRELFGTE